MNPDQTPLEPRPHQLEAIAAVAGELAGGGRAHMVAACGSGKTLIGRWVDERLQARRTVVVVPSLILLAQTLREWRDAGGTPFEAFVCCSDPTTPKGIAERATAAGFDLDVPFWSEQRAQVSTSAVDVNRWLRDAPADRPVVVFSTHHSLKVVGGGGRAAHPDRLRLGRVRRSPPPLGPTVCERHAVGTTNDQHIVGPGSDEPGPTAFWGCGTRFLPDDQRNWTTQCRYRAPEPSGGNACHRLQAVSSTRSASSR